MASTKEDTREKLYQALTSTAHELFKDDDKELILQDENNDPSFEAREAPYHITSDYVKVYNKKDFVFTSLYLSYYRYPVQIKLLDDEDPESGFDPEFNPEFFVKKAGRSEKTGFIIFSILRSEILQISATPIAR